MAFQQGSLTVTQDGTLKQVVTFGAPFAVAPEIVIPVVKYVGVGTPLLVEAKIIEITATTFTVQYDADLSGDTNYQLGFVAGDSTVMFDLVATAGIKVSALPEATSMDAGDWLLMVDISEGVTKKISKANFDLS
jgi:hypothetical protein